MIEGYSITNRNGDEAFLTETARQCLLRILFASPDASSPADWPSVFQTAETWSVVPQLAARIQELGLRPPADLWADFKRVHIATFARSASRASKGAAALLHLERAGIPAAAFKGLASMARLYPIPANRTIKDADILIEPQHVPAALSCLSELGLVSREGYDLGRWDRFLDHSPGFSGNKAMVLSEAGGMEIDLHWDVGGLQPAELLACGETLPLFTSQVRVVSAADGMILTARHSIRENLAIDAICRDLFDLRLSCDYLSSRGMLAPALQRVRESTSLVPLLALTGILQAMDGDSGAVRDSACILAGFASPKQRQSASHLQTLFFHQVNHGPIGKDLLYLSHSIPARQILAGAFTNWKEYRSFMKTMEEKWDGGEVPLGRRLWKLMVGMKNSAPAHWRGMRTLARLKYGRPSGLRRKS